MSIACHDHNPSTHRDGKPPWCGRCGLTADFTKPVSKFPGGENSEKPIEVPLTCNGKLVGKAHIYSNGSINSLIFPDSVGLVDELKELFSRGLANSLCVDVEMKTVHSPNPVQDEVEKKYSWHTPTFTSTSKHKQIRAAFKEVGRLLEDILPNNDARKVADNYLQTAAMWANKSVSENDPIDPER